MATVMVLGVNSAATHNASGRVQRTGQAGIAHTTFTCWTVGIGWMQTCTEYGTRFLIISRQTGVTVLTISRFGST